MEPSIASEPSSPEELNKARFFDLTVDQCDLSILVPETPSSQLPKRRRRRTRHEEEAFSPVMTRRSVDRAKCSGGPSKRRKLSEAKSGRNFGFVPASSLGLFPAGSWFDASSSSSSSSSSPSSFLTLEQDETATMQPSSCRNSLSFLTAEERRWLSGEQADDRTTEAPPEVVISDDEDMPIRMAQMEEDEVFARSLQAQFDQEEAESHHHYHQMHHMHADATWTPHLLAAAMSPLAPLGQDGVRRQPRRGRGQRRDTPLLSDDLAANDYEALLEFEERQGAVVSKKMTRSEIERFPVKSFQSGGGNTQCQICFCDYDQGDKLRMLPCFHDYHVPCIDRWLKDNTTCPICRVNLADDDIMHQ
ncbi:uncharacterized protein si:ch211-59o9.10 [Nerophis ophidion]|uniref:uncharacterized protein si:ch211-59o9.10 n=1 Tax=Nerophis ophidion TaxID=159077 RepID=UPI002ADF4915|nr:uncharacterized protein si:ch211-59o9.10 [Nerophis ophidion]